MLGMDTFAWMQADPGVLAPLLPLAFLVSFFYLMPRISGWSALVRRFRAPGPYGGEQWRWQSARFRGWFGYNNCLIVGADSQWLSLSLMKLFRLPGHPDLLIPWSEIEVEMRKAFFGTCEMVQLRIGIEERVTVRFYGKLVGRLRQAAGSGWPLNFQEQMNTPAIGDFR
jgi:hypothetical protein